MLKLWASRNLATWAVSGVAAAALMATGATAQITTVDPNTVLDADLDGPKPPADAPSDYLPPSATTPPPSAPNSGTAIDPNSDLITNNVVYDDPAVQSAPQNEVREASRHINDCGGFGPKTDANFLRLGIRKPSFISTPALDAVQTNGMRTRSSHAVVPYR